MGNHKGRCHMKYYRHRWEDNSNTDFREIGCNQLRTEFFLNMLMNLQVL
jgi:hypothetical protein